jgi:hypothetical protein
MLVFLQVALQIEKVGWKAAGNSMGNVVFINTGMPFSV